MCGETLGRLRPFGDTRDRARYMPRRQRRSGAKRMKDREPSSHRTAADSAYARGWAASRIVPLATVDPAMDGIADAAKGARVYTGQFVLKLAPPLKQHWREDALHHTSFFRDFLTHPAVAEQIAASGPCHLVEKALSDPTLGLRSESSWLMLARLAEAVAGNHTGENCRMVDPRTSSVVNAFADAAFCGRHSLTTAYWSDQPWSDWFCGEGRDYSFLWLDNIVSVATLVLVSAES